MIARSCRFRIVLAGLLLLVPQLALGQSDPAASDGEASRPDVSTIRPDLLTKLASPQSTLTTFREALGDEDRRGDAAACLDLSGIDAAAAANREEDWVFRLGGILTRSPFIAVDEVPNDPDWPDPVSLAYVLHQQYDDFGERLTRSEIDDLEKIVITKCADGLWRFAGGTLDELDDIWTRWDAKAGRDDTASVSLKPLSERVKDLFPLQFQRKRFLLQDYQWICLLTLIAIGFATDIVVRFVLRRLTAIWIHFSGSPEDTNFQHRLWRPIGLLSQALVWYSGTKTIALPAETLAVLLAGLKFFAVVSAVWTGFLLVDLLSRRWLEKAAHTDSKYDDLLVPLISKSLKAFAICIGIFALAETFGWPLTGLLGGLGLGGAALAFASKDTVANLFGSLTVLVDRPFEIGDSIISNNIEGTVEKVGFRSTRVRTFYNSLVTVPNSLFTTAVVDNMGRREFRRIKLNLGLEYGTSPDQIEAFCEGVRELLRRNPHVRKDNFQVYFNQFNDSSLDILLYFFVKCSEWSQELRLRHELFLNISRVAERLGVSFAFPTRTLHVLNEEAGDGEPANFEDPLAAGRKSAADVSDSD